MIKELQVNKRIDILVEDGVHQGSYLSKVAEVNKDDFKVTAPFSKGEIVPLRMGQPVQLFCTGNSAAYTFLAKVIGRQNKPVALLTLEKTSEIKRIQRREFFRLKAKRKVDYRVIDDDKGDEGFKDTMTVDISAGGLKLIVGDSMPTAGMLELTIDIPGLENVILKGEIVNTYDLPDGSAISVEFLDIKPNQQDAIITWLFDYQRELRQKGLL